MKRQLILLAVALLLLTIIVLLECVFLDVNIVHALLPANMCLGLLLGVGAAFLSERI